MAIDRARTRSRVATGRGRPPTPVATDTELVMGAMFVAVATRGHFVALCVVLGAPELAEEPRFATNAARIAHRAEFDEVLASRFSTRTASEWARDLIAAGVPCGPVHSVRSALEDPQIRDGGFIADASTKAGSFRMLRSPIRVDDAWLPVRRSPPELDQDGDAIRASLEDT